MIPERIVQLLGAMVTVTVVRGALVFVVVSAAVLVARRLRAAGRHLVWLGVFASFLLIPLAWLALPGIHLGPWIPRAPVADLGLAVAPALSRPEYALLIERTSAETTRALWPHPLPSGEIFLGLLCAWAAGVILLAVRLAVGTVRIRRLAASARVDRRARSVATGIAADINLRRQFRVGLSPRCQIPFTLGVAAPAVILPAKSMGWSDGRLEAVLTHELMHIRRRDVLAHSAAYAVCVLLWFFPPVWIAYAALLREAETSCDQVVIDRGIRAPAYAHDILDLVRACHGRMLLPAMTTALAGPAMIKERIRSVLALKPSRRRFLLRNAVAVLVVFACCLFPVLAVSGRAWASGLPVDDPFFGTWVVDEGTNLRGLYNTWKTVITADGHYFEYLTDSDETPMNEGWFTVEKAWVETGAHLYNVRAVSWAYPGRAGKTERLVLVCISADGSTREFVWTQNDYPETISSLGPGYRIMHRQE